MPIEAIPAVVFGIGASTSFTETMARIGPRSSARSGSGWRSNLRSGNAVFIAVWCTSPCYRSTSAFLPSNHAKTTRLPSGVCAVSTPRQPGVALSAPITSGSRRVEAGGTPGPTMRGPAGERPTRRSSSTNLPGRDLAERPRGTHGPVVQRLRSALAVVERHQPVRELGMSTMLTAQTALDLGIRQQQRLLAFLELANVAEADGDRRLGAEEQLEQHLTAKPFRPRRLSQPRPH